MLQARLISEVQTILAEKNLNKKEPKESLTEDVWLIA
jgi:hypothetical protein